MLPLRGDQAWDQSNADERKDDAAKGKIQSVEKADRNPWSNTSNDQETLVWLLWADQHVVGPLHGLESRQIVAPGFGMGEATDLCSVVWN